MTDFIAKMNPTALPGADGGAVHVPAPNRKENTPLPQPGDRLLLWMNGHGLVGEGIIATFDPARTPNCHLRCFWQHDAPFLGDGWLKHAPDDRTSPDIRTRLRAATTTTGGLRELRGPDLHDLETARLAAVGRQI